MRTESKPARAPDDIPSDMHRHLRARHGAPLPPADALPRAGGSAAPLNVDAAFTRLPISPGIANSRALLARRMFLAARTYLTYLRNQHEHRPEGLRPASTRRVPDENRSQRCRTRRRQLGAARRADLRQTNPRQECPAYQARACRVLVGCQRPQAGLARRDVKRGRDLTEVGIGWRGHTGGGCGHADSSASEGTKAYALSRAATIAPSQVSGIPAHSFCRVES
jgi:hypothetical protein